MNCSPRDCAREVLDVTPIIIQAIRFEMRSQRLTELSVPQFRSLAYINNNPGASLSAAAEFIGLTLSSMSILVNGLVDRGYVERTVSSEDRRRIHLTLTSDGAELFAHALQGTEERLAELLRSLSADERATVVKALALLRPIFLPRAQAPVRAAQPAADAAATPGGAPAQQHP